MVSAGCTVLGPGHRGKLQCLLTDSMVDHLSRLVIQANIYPME